MKWTAGILAGLLVIASRPTHGFCLNWSSLEGYTLTESTGVTKTRVLRIQRQVRLLQLAQRLVRNGRALLRDQRFKPRRRHRLDFRA